MYGQAVDTRSPERNKQGRNNPTLPVILNANGMLTAKKISYKVRIIQIFIISLCRFQREASKQGPKIFLNLFKIVLVFSNITRTFEAY